MTVKPAAFLAALFLTLASLATPSPARAEGEQQTLAITGIQAVQLLIANGRFEDARKLLERELAARPDDSEALFLMASIDVAGKDYDGAIALFRKILAREPDAERVRLELARAFFLKGDYDNADRQFRFARAGDIPDTVKANIDRFLSAINRLRQWKGDVSLALAPDTNQNTGTAASQVIVFGLPFTLDPNARRQSGLGVAADVNGEWSPLLWDDVKARIGGDVSRLDYSGGRFDDMTVSGYAGPQFLFSDWDFSILATGFRRWYGNHPYISGEGGKIAAEFGITSDMVIGASLGGQDVRDYFIPLQNGPLYSAQAQAIYVLSPSRLVQFQGGFNRQEAQIAPYSYSAVWFGGGYQQDLPLGFSAGFQPSYYMTRYDAALAAFGVTRQDNAVLLSFNLLNRRLDYHGFTPRLSYVFTDQHSNIPLYSYTRSQIQLGLTTLF